MTIRFHKKNVLLAAALEEMSLTYIDVTVLLKGNMYYSINGKPVILHSGDAIVFQPGDVRARKESRDAEYWSFNVIPDEDGPFPVFHGPVRQCLTDELLLILDLASKISMKTSSSTEEMFIHIFSLLYYELYDRSKATQDSDIINKVKDYILTHISEPLSLPQISSHVFLSPNYCNSIFKRQTGRTITSYVIWLKMERAKDYLLNTDIPLTEISSLLGYSHYSYFSRLFKQIMKISPGKMRQSYVYATKEAVDGF